MDDDSYSKKSSLASIVAGIIYGAAWWIFIDGYATCTGDCGPTDETKGYAWLPLFGATISFFMINGMRWSELRADDLTGDNRTAAKAKLFLLFALFIGMICVAGAGFLMGVRFLKSDTAYHWSGVSCFVGTMMILLSAFIMRAGTKPPTDY